MSVRSALPGYTPVRNLAAIRGRRPREATLGHLSRLTPPSPGLPTRRMRFEPVTGIEPARFALQVRCSTTELHRHTGLGTEPLPFGGEGGNRTPVLSPASWSSTGVFREGRFLVAEALARTPPSG